MLKLLYAAIFPLLLFGVVLADLAIDALIDAALDYSFRGRSANPWLAGAVYIFLGAGIGLETVDLFPHRLLPIQLLFPGMSLILVPMAGGLLAEWFGSWRRQQARESSWMATFWGGALFAFAIALARWAAVTAR